MIRGIDNKNILDEFAIEFCKIVEKHTKYIIVSGFLVISLGRTRATEDIDMIIKPIDIKKFRLLHSDLIKNNFVCMQSDDYNQIYSYLNENLSVRYTYNKKPLPEMEVKFAQDELDLYQIKTRIKIPLTNLDIYFSSVEMNIAFKEEYLKSPKDMEDAKHLRKVYPIINEEEIEDIKRKIRKIKLK